jgi:hypothetical protein
MYSLQDDDRRFVTVEVAMPDLRISTLIRRDLTRYGNRRAGARAVTTATLFLL